MLAEHKHRQDLKDRISSREKKGRVITDIRAFQNSNRMVSGGWLVEFRAPMSNLTVGVCRTTAALQKRYCASYLLRNKFHPNDISERQRLAFEDQAEQAAESQAAQWPRH